MSLPQSSVGKNSLPNLPDRETLWQQTYLEAFQKNYDSVQRWTRWKEDHENVKSTLSTLPDKLSHEVVIPFGSKALVKAKLVHTNEVLTCIGDGWFVKQSAKQGVAMCERRIKHSEEMMRQLDRERTLLTNRQTLPKLEEAFADDETKEIVEEYNEEAEAEWRRQHREREAEYRRKLADLRKRQVDHPPVQTEEDIFRRLDELELEEELNDELERLHAEYEADYENNDEDDEGETTEEDADDEDVDGGNDNDSSTDSRVTQTALLNDKKPSVESKPEAIDTSVSSGSSREERKYNYPGVFTNSTLSTCEAWGENSSIDFEKMKKSRRISFADESQSLKPSPKYTSTGDKNIYIRFQHSKDSSKEPSYKAPSAKDGAPVYNTPADIFENHRAQLTSPQPKSILKKSSSYPEKLCENNHNKPIPTSASFGSSFGMNLSDSEDDDHIPPVRDISHLPQVLCDVKETTSSASQPRNQEPLSQRPLSRFKQARQSGRRP